MASWYYRLTPALWFVNVSRIHEVVCVWTTNSLKTIFVKLRSIRTQDIIGPNRRLNQLCFAGYVHMQCLTQHAFPHSWEHRTSFQAFCRYINISSCLQDLNTIYNSSQRLEDSSAVFSTMKRNKNRRASAIPNARKMYDEAQMTRRVKSYLSNLPSNRDEEKLAEMSNQCEAPAGMVLHALIQQLDL